MKGEGSSLNDCAPVLQSQISRISPWHHQLKGSRQEADVKDLSLRPRRTAVTPNSQPTGMAWVEGSFMCSHGLPGTCSDMQPLFLSPLGPKPASQAPAYSQGGQGTVLVIDRANSTREKWKQLSWPCCPPPPQILLCVP